MNDHNLESDIPLREYLEHQIGDQRAYFERIIAEHEAHHDRDRAADQRALDEARDRIDTRLEQLNQLRTEVVSDRGLFLTRDVFDARLGQADTDRNRLRDELASVRQELAATRGRQAAYTAVLAVALVVVPFLIQLFLSSR